MLGASRKLKSQLEALRLDVDGLRQEFAALKNKLETDLETVKKDFREFLLLFEDATMGDELSDEALPKKEDATPEEILPPEARETKTNPEQASGAETGSVLSERPADARGSDTDIQLLSEKLESLIKWAEHFEQETRTIKNDIREARKDIKSKIAYSVSRLRT